MIYAGLIEETEALETFQVYRNLWRAHLRFYERYLFGPNLCREHFIYCDAGEMNGEDEVMVMKVAMHDQDVLTVNGSDLPDLERGRVDTMRCQASEAHALITDVVKGKKKWRGVSVEIWIK